MSDESATPVSTDEAMAEMRRRMQAAEPRPPAPASEAPPAPALPVPEAAPERPRPARARRRAKANPHDEGSVSIGGRFPADLRRRLKVAAAEQDKSLAEIMAEAFEAYLARRERRHGGS
jgi:hypothetical protein